MRGGWLVADGRSGAWAPFCFLAGAGGGGHLPLFHIDPVVHDFRALHGPPPGTTPSAPVRALIRGPWSSTRVVGDDDW